MFPVSHKSLGWLFTLNRTANLRALKPRQLAVRREWRSTGGGPSVWTESQRRAVGSAPCSIFATLALSISYGLSVSHQGNSSWHLIESPRAAASSDLSSIKFDFCALKATGLPDHSPCPPSFFILTCAFKG